MIFNEAYLKDFYFYNFSVLTRYPKEPIGLSGKQNEMSMRLEAWRTAGRSASAAETWMSNLPSTRWRSNRNPFCSAQVLGDVGVGNKHRYFKFLANKRLHYILPYVKIVMKLMLLMILI